jgi:ABC-type amino acid transport substrate-binding protein
MRFAAITLVLSIGVVAGTRVLLEAVLRRPYDKDVMLTGRGMLRERPPARVLDMSQGIPPLPAPKTSVLARVLERSTLRVGYFDDSLPFVFFNRSGELVGFDVEMALQLASDLGVQAEFVPVSRSILDTGLEPSVCDVLMTGVAVTSDRAQHVQFSSTYLDETIAFIVPDNRTAAFSDWDSVRAMRHLRLGVLRAPYFMQKIQDELTDVELVPFATFEEMFAPPHPPLEAVIATAERGSAFTLLHPEYSVVVPKPRLYKVPLAYVIAGRDTEFTAMVNTWVELVRKHGTIDELFAHWILGQDSRPKQPRWSILDNVLSRAAR